MQDLAFCDWSLRVEQSCALSVMSSGVTHVAAHVRISFPREAE